jgi:hypothetical protein
VTLVSVVVDEPDVRDTYQNLRLHAESLTLAPPDSRAYSCRCPPDFQDVAGPHPQPQVRAPALKSRLLGDPLHRVVAGLGRGRLPAHIPGVTAITLPVRTFIRPGVDLAFQVAAHVLVLFAAHLAARVALF